MKKSECLFSSSGPAHKEIDSLEEVGRLLGQYTVEAMGAIDQENARRNQILKNPESTPEEKTEALEAGVWYVEENTSIL